METNGTTAGVSGVKIINGIPIGASYGSITPSHPLPTESERSEIGKTKALYVQIPFLAGTSFFQDRVSINAGAVASLMIYATSYRTDLISVKAYTATSDFTTVLGGAMIQASFNLTSSLGIDFSAQHYFNPLYDRDHQVAGKARMNLISAGISYIF